ncbi:MAG: energy transducer TonB [Steroidobacteraceae bacterium]
MLLKKGTWAPDLVQDFYFILAFTIGKDGRVSDVEVATRGFASKAVLESAIRYVKSYVFKPPTRDGKPYEMKVRQPFTVSLKGGQGISPEFVKEARKVEALIKAGDYAGGDFHAQWMLSEVVRTRSEYAALQGTLAVTYAGSGKVSQAMSALRAATQRIKPSPELVLRQSVPPNAVDNYLIQDAKYISNLLELKMRLGIQQGMVLDALRAYYELAGFRSFPPDDPYVRVANELTAHLEGTAPLVAKVELNEYGRWVQELFRRDFTLERVQGVVKGIEINCEDQFRFLEYGEDMKWAVPDSWEKCAIVVEGEPGTRLHIVELAPSQAG